MIDPISKFIIDHLLDGFAGVILPLLLISFAVATVFRVLIYYTVRAQSNFARTFESRVADYYSAQEDNPWSFHEAVTATLSKTYDDYFHLRQKNKRRAFDHITSLADRLFLIQDSISHLTNDLSTKISKLSVQGNTPNFTGIIKSSFDRNPKFEKLMGVIRMQTLNDVINVLPSLFIIGGIFGTFIGISKGLPDLGGMDLANVESSKQVMDVFLIRISQAMVKSIVGIGLSVCMNLINTIFAPEPVFSGVVNRYLNSIEYIWDVSCGRARGGSGRSDQDSGSGSDSDPGSDSGHSDFQQDSQVLKMPKLG